jgi:voltage-gated potassium channel
MRRRVRFHVTVKEKNMASKPTKHRELKSIGYELFIGALSILSIVNLILLIFTSDPALNTVLQLVNAVMFPIFLGDFLYRFFTSSNRSDYFLRGFGWADLLSSLPFQQLKIFRVFRIWRVIRLFMEFGARNLVHEFVTHRAENALLTVGFLVLCVLEFGSLAVLKAESASPDANITTAGDALWWAYVTITTVGYGDRYPVTNWGRIVGVIVMTAGVGLFGTLSGYLANQFLSPPKQQTEEGAGDDSASPKVKLAGLRRMIEAQEESTAKLKAQLEEIDKLL